MLCNTGNCCSPPLNSKSQANVRRAYACFPEELFEACAKPGVFASIAFALAYFHACLVERKRFGVGNLPGARRYTHC